jgi:single-strand DNA-binding protein
MPAPINVVVVSGRATRDADAIGQKGANIRLVTNTSYKDKDDEWQEKAHYFTVKLWGDHLSKKGLEVKRGEAITVAGRLEYEEWEGKDGKRSEVVINAQTIVATAKAPAKAAEDDEDDGGLPF